MWHSSNSVIDEMVEKMMIQAIIDNGFSEAYIWDVIQLSSSLDDFKQKLKASLLACSTNENLVLEHHDWKWDMNTLASMIFEASIVRYVTSEFDDYFDPRKDKYLGMPAFRDSNQLQKYCLQSTINALIILTSALTSHSTSLLQTKGKILHIQQIAPSKKTEELLSLVIDVYAEVEAFAANLLDDDYYTNLK